MTKTPSHPWNQKPSTSAATLVTASEACRLAGNVTAITLLAWQMNGTIPAPRRIRGVDHWPRTELLNALKAAGDTLDRSAGGFGAWKQQTETTEEKAERLHNEETDPKGGGCGYEFKPAARFED